MCVTSRSFEKCLSKLSHLKQDEATNNIFDTGNISPLLQACDT